MEVVPVIKITSVTIFMNTVLHTSCKNATSVKCWSWSHITTDSRSVSMSRCQAHSGILLSVWRLLSESYCHVSVGHPLWGEVRSVICHSRLVVNGRTSQMDFIVICYFKTTVSILKKIISMYIKLKQELILTVYCFSYSICMFLIAYTKHVWAV
jgi:hypothetical protein